MHVCKMYSSALPEIKTNTVCRLTLTATKFGNNTLNGEFSVGGGRVVEFSQGNLYWNGDGYHFEKNQYDYPISRNLSHLGHFFWSQNPEVARATTYEDSLRGEHDVFFTNATETTPSSTFTVESITGRFRTLSMVEWKYLFKSRANADKLYKINVSVCGKENSLVIAPDNFQEEIKPTYQEEEWAKVQRDGLVCLLMAGYTFASNTPYSSVGYYWSSAPWTISGAQHIAFAKIIDDIAFESRESIRDYGCCVRLVKDVVAK
ncbi:MAG: hypothetical protein KBS95_00020 [Alistipes sp.]|nr:hypothetical protein [Candidatus Alistipes equi]